MNWRVRKVGVDLIKQMIEELKAVSSDLSSGRSGYVLCAGIADVREKMDTLQRVIEEATNESPTDPAEE